MNFAIYNPETNHVSTIVSAASGELPIGYTFIPEDEVPENANRNPLPSTQLVPQSVTPRQIRRALSTLGLRTTVESMIAASSQEMQDDWEFALEVRRDWPALILMAQQLGKSPEEIDDLFRLAETY